MNSFQSLQNRQQRLCRTIKDVVYKGFDENTASVNSFYAMCDAINDTLREQLQDEHLTFEEKSVIIDKMIKLAKMKAEKDAENKKFISGVIGKVTLGIGIAVGAVAAVLGAQTSISSGTSEDDADNSDLDIVDYQQKISATHGLAFIALKSMALEGVFFVYCPANFALRSGQKTLA